MRAALAALVALLAAAAAAAAPWRAPLSPWRPPAGLQRTPAATGRDLLSRCRLTWRNATLDHFSWARPEGGHPGRFAQRVFLCDEAWRPAPDGTRGPIFFYLGNEADVTLYLNHTGLMWENAERFGALLVFAEHRYYGRSKPFVSHLTRHMGYLSAEQALADYAELITELRGSLPGAGHSPVIGFGGSYGGMLAAWMRLKYPHLLDGAVAASAPIWNFLGEEPAFEDTAFARGVTYDASTAGGSPPGCVEATRRAWQVLVRLGRSAAGRAAIAASMRLCPDVALRSEADVVVLRDWLASAWDYLAMGDFPYPSSYMTNGAGDLPAYPVRVACGHMTRQPSSSSSSSSNGDGDGAASDAEHARLMRGLALAAGVLYNFTGDLKCLNPGTGPSPESDEDSNFWDFQWCTEMLMPSARDGVHDMFWREPFNLSASLAACEANWDVQPKARTWANIQWGGRRIQAGSNIVFSNGLLDPWHGGGVLRNISDSLVAVVIPEGAHHLDLMFSHPLDPPSVKAARATQLRHIAAWVAEASQAWSDQRARWRWWERERPWLPAAEAARSNDERSSSSSSPWWRRAWWRSQAQLGLQRLQRAVWRTGAVLAPA